MKRMLIVFVAIAALAAAEASAGPPPAVPEYGGKVDNKRNRYLGFDVVKRSGKKTIRGIFLGNVPVKCNDGGRVLGYGVGPGFVRVKQDGSFRKLIRARFGDIRGSGPEITGYNFRFKGKLEGKRAEGKGRITTLGRRCDSGRFTWKARKPGPLPPASEKPTRLVY